MPETNTDKTIIDTLSVENIKTVAGAGAHSIAVLCHEMGASAARRTGLADAAYGAMLKRLSELDVQEGAGEQMTATANLPGRQIELSSALAQVVAEMGTALGAIQQLVKTAQTTPPVTP